MTGSVTAAAAEDSTARRVDDPTTRSIGSRKPLRFDTCDEGSAGAESYTASGDHLLDSIVTKV